MAPGGTAVYGAIKSSDVYAEAVGSAKASEQVKVVLGEPVEPGWWVAGSLRVNGPNGTAEDPQGVPVFA